MSRTPVLTEVEDTPDEELVALVLGGRSKEISIASTDAATLLLSRCAGIADLSRADAAEIEAALVSIHVPRARQAARALAAAFELGRRVTVAERTPLPRFAGSSDAAAWAIPRLGRLAHEELWMLAMDGRGRLRAARRIARGGLHGVSVKASDAVRSAVRTGATGFVLVHNHPSGDATPSAHDLAFTREVANAASVVGVPLLDHLVVSADDFVSVPLEGDRA